MKPIPEKPKVRKLQILDDSDDDDHIPIGQIMKKAEETEVPQQKKQKVQPAKPISFPSNVPR